MDFQDQLKVVLVAPRNPLNIGAAARAMSNFGFLSLRVVNAWEVAYAEARSAVNASAVLENSQQFSSVAEAVADCDLVVGTTAVGHRALAHPLRRLEYGGRTVRDHLSTGRTALLFGSEKFGLSNEDLSHCQWLMRIPTRDEHQSMNLGQAVAVCLYEIIRSDAAERHEPAHAQNASAGERERLSELLLEALELSGYVKDRTGESTALKVRRLVHRMCLAETDAPVWQGMFRQILWRLRS